MKIRRKSTQCLNCKTTLDSVYNYCPKCGQENNHNNVSVKTLLGDFFNTYLAIDSRFGKSIIPFFVRPGYLTKKYIEGKRVSYAHPLRLYLIISIFYFFTVALVSREITDEDDGAVVKTVVDIGNLENAEGYSLKTKEEILKSLKRKQREELDSLMESGDALTLVEFLSELDSSRQLKVRRNVGENVADELNLVRKGPNGDTRVPLDKDPPMNDLLNQVDSDGIRQYDKEYENITDKQIYDSLGYHPEMSGFKRLVVMQGIRIQRADDEAVTGYVIKNLPLMMLLLIPIFALILKLFYIRRNQLYIKHIVHALHLHSFAYLTYGIFLLVYYFFISDEDYAVFWFILGFTVVTVYAYLSFKWVYNQKWLKTFIKFNLVGFIYSMMIMIFFGIEMIISLLLY